MEKDLIMKISEILERKQVPLPTLKLIYYLLLKA